MEIENLIIERRPKLSKSSVKTYKSILSNLYKNVFETDNNASESQIDVKKFEEVDKIIKYLKQMLEPNQRKTVLSALFVITDDKKYRDLMIDDIDKYNEEENKQEIKDDKKDSWTNTDDISKLYSELEQNALFLMKKKKNLTTLDLQHIQNFIILCLLGGVYIPPRRSKDYTEFKIKNIDKEKDNFRNKNEFVFNTYKTAKFYGQQKIPIPQTLGKILNKWYKINPTEYLLFDSSLGKLTNVKLNQRLNKIFGNKKIGVNSLRHSYLSDKYQDTIKRNEDLEDDMKAMGSSKLQEKVYIKKMPK
jgi:integrase